MFSVEIGQILDVVLFVYAYCELYILELIIATNVLDGIVCNLLVPCVNISCAFKMRWRKFISGLGLLCLVGIVLC